MTVANNKLWALLLLGRVSNLPTVWSNCLAAWVLAGEGSLDRLLILCFGASCSYIGGMYLNDAFDADFDRQHRKERPIPQGTVAEREVWAWGLAWLGIGLFALFSLGWTTGLFALLLTGGIVLYDAVHKSVAFSPILMAACRFLLYLTAASAGAWGISGRAIWCGLALAAYVVGLSFLARRESTGGLSHYWPVALLGVPMLFAFLMNGDGWRFEALLFSLLLGIWIARCLSHLFWTRQPNIGRAVSGLLAGVVLVDLLAVAGGTGGTGVLLLACFGAALLFQRVVPAT